MKQHPPQPLMPEGMSADDINQLAALAKLKTNEVLTKIPLLGPIAWLMIQQPATRHTLLSELEWRIMPALALNQVKLYMRDNTPIAFASWAKLSDSVAKRYMSQPHQLSPSDWNSGEQVWLVDLFTPYGGAQETLTDLRTQVHPNVAIHQLVPNEQGHAKMISWPADVGGSKR